MRQNPLPLTRNTLAITLGIFIAVSSPALGQQVPEGFTVTVVQDELDRGSVGFSLLPDGRILVIHHQSGRVELIVDGVLQEEPVLVVDSLVTSSEQGLLGIALDPDFPDSNYVYLFHTRSDSTNQVSRYPIEGALSDSFSIDLRIDPASRKKVFSAPDTTKFHNGGTLRFGSDKTLYMSFGDDAQAARVQSIANLYGKIFRIHRDGSIPDDNPVFPEEPEGKRGEIFAMGLRNPFRFSIDPLTDELFIGDVGTNLYEELDFASGGENFGYPRYEGPTFFREYEALIPPDPTFPAHAYPRATNARAVIALATYRPKNGPGDFSFPEAYSGASFFADFFDKRLQYLLKDDQGNISLHALGTDFYQLVDAAVAPDGSLYLLSYDGILWRIGYGSMPVAVEGEIEAPAFTLHQNYPNPFRGSSTISYGLHRAGPVKIELFDMLGRRVATVVDEWQASGSHLTMFEPEDLPAGVYVLQAQSGGFIVAKTMTLLGR